MATDDPPASPPESAPPSAHIPAGAFVLSPRVVAVVSVLIGVACLAALVVVTTVQESDALSTIALALAILAFAAQLIIYIAQAASANQQLVLAQDVQRETASLLRGIEASAAVTQALLSRQYERVIDRLISTTADAESPAEDREALLEQLRAVVREEVAASQPITTLSPNTQSFWDYRGGAIPNTFTTSGGPYKIGPYKTFSLSDLEPTEMQPQGTEQGQKPSEKPGQDPAGEDD